MSGITEEVAMASTSEVEGPRDSWTASLMGDPWTASLMGDTWTVSLHV